MHMLKQLGFYIALFPVALITSAETAVMAAFLFGISLLVKPKIIWMDLPLLLLLVLTVVSYMAVGSFGREYIPKQVGAYVVVIFALRFFYVCRQDLLEFLVSLSPLVYAILGLIYLAVQVKVGYTYEVGIFETYLLIRLTVSDKSRLRLVCMLIGYFMLMFVISTRATPFVVGALVALVYFMKVPKRILSTFYISVVILTPMYGFIMYYLDIEQHVSGTVENAAIRLEMIKGATSMIGVKEFFLGTGFGVPFRDVNYSYSFPHPLLNDIGEVMQVSNHNSIFDVFLRFGLFFYALFAVVFLRVLSVGQIEGTRAYALLFITLYNLSINAFLDSTRLCHVSALLIAGIYFACERTKPAQSVGEPILTEPERTTG
ncbi:hypothetical protein [Pseudomonas huanghezhanensis]|uniref:hypothetical protein n=1 Tax=Pseudomonas huanghezhanensis TaxID=3002903 RepID=UPI002285B759|nr:hypothetical protein [Pseudomonas sp. BSw22131]